MGILELPDKQVHQVAWRQWLALVPALLLLKLWLRTLRIHLTTPPASARAGGGQQEPGGPYLPPSGGGLLLFWHNRILVTPEVRRRFRPQARINGLVSASKDGAWLAAAFRAFRIGTVRGSSSWRGGAAVRETLRLLKAGEVVAVTPDGPRGPCYAWKSGAARLAHRCRLPVELVGMRFHNAVRLRSWDGFYLPLPFSRVDLTFDKVPLDDPDRWLSESDFSERLRQRLMALTDDAKG